MDIVAGNLTSNSPGDPIRFDAPQLLLSDGLYNAFPSMALSPGGVHALGYRVGISHVGDDDAGRAVIRKSAAFPTFGAEIAVATEEDWDIRCAQPTWLSESLLLVAYWKRVPGSVTIVNGCRTVLSTDAGVTWGAPVEVLDGLTGFSACEGPAVVLPDGNLGLAVYGEGLDPGDDRRSSVLMVSNDNGASWVRRSTIADGQTDGRDYNEPNLVVVGSTVVCLAHPNVADGTDKQYVFRSTDSGATWTGPVASFSGTGAAHLALIDATKVLACFRSVSPLNKNVARLSRDGGLTWSAQYQVPGTNNSMYMTAVDSGLATFNAVYAYSSGGVANLKSLTGVAS